MPVKSGDWRTARILYANARLSPTCATWPFKDVPEQRIVVAQKNVVAFSAPGTSGGGMMRGSAYGCVACHQER